ncbi:hypothetical protein [Spirosoma endophyticum]|uniref:hypothetical protein n=1 Tax=Spirosoma endophyticum TaxID=662367 RepID=UPI000B81B663|nr:hypothetical protein [Spirosoma endophyticum]
METEIRLFNGGRVWGQVVEWGPEQLDNEEIWGWGKKRLPFLVLVYGQLYQRGADGYYFLTQYSQ